jgi:ribose transport system substrate-binding protein
MPPVGSPKSKPPELRFKRQGRSAWRGVSVAALAAAALMLAACGTAAKSSATAASGSASAAPEPSSSVSSTIIGSLPSSVRGFYANITEPVNASPYASFTPPKAPWNVCFEDSYEGNSWRINVRTQLAALAKSFETAGKVASFSYSVSNDSPTLEDSQLRTFIDKGCNLILLEAGSSTGDNATIAQARQHGIVVVAFNNYVTSPDAEVVDQPWFQWGAAMAQEIATKLHGHGTVIYLQGIPGESVAVAENAGAASVWAKYPGITLIPANGNWTPTTTSTVIRQVLATHPGTIGGVWTTGSELWYVEQAFASAGRQIPIITGTPEGNTLALAKANPSVGTEMFGAATLPVPIADYAFDTGARILSGEHPIVSPILFPLSNWSGSDLTGWYGSCMTQAGGEPPFPVPPTQPLTDAQMNAYFTSGHEVAPYSYQGTLTPPCP